jgi:hypothetical protein
MPINRKPDPVRTLVRSRLNAVALGIALFVVLGCAVFPTPTPMPADVGDPTGVTVTVENFSPDDVQVLGLDPRGPHLLPTCETFRWLVPSGRVALEVLTPTRRVSVPLEVDAKVDQDILVVVRSDGVIEPVQVPEGELWWACARGGKLGGGATSAP